MRQQKFRALKSLRQLLPDRFLDDPRPGEADPLSSPVSVPDQVAALAALLRQETDAQRPAIAFGRSYGGRLVLDLPAGEGLAVIGHSHGDARCRARPGIIGGISGRWIVERRSGQGRLPAGRFPERSADTTMYAAGAMPVPRREIGGGAVRWPFPPSP